MPRHWNSEHDFRCSSWQLMARLQGWRARGSRFCGIGSLNLYPLMCQGHRMPLASVSRVKIPCWQACPWV